MKKYIYQLLCSLFIGATMVACAEDYMETDKGHDTLTLSVNQQELVLNEKNHSQEALALSWTTGTNYGSGNRISYTLELAKAGTDFANPYSVDLGTGTYQWTKKVEELNQFLNTQFGIGYAVKAELEARITAVVAGMEDQKQIATTAFTVTTYQPVTTTLYLIGDAAPSEWSADNATAMERTDNGQFTWTGKLNTGSFKFITTLGEFLPSYNRDATAEEGFKLTYRTSGDQPDEQFTISKEATYIVKANLLDLTLTLTETEDIGWRYEEFFIVGSFTGNNGWGAGKHVIGILHNGDIVACTSIRDKTLVAGNIREKSLKSIWESPDSFKWNRNFDSSKLKGFCRECRYTERCLGGCSNSRYCINGSFESENRYCAYNVEMKKWKKYLESLNDISEIDNVIEKAAALKHQDLYKIACEIKQSKL